VKLAMMIGSQIQGVLRFVLSQTDGITGADSLLGPEAVMRSTVEWLKKLGLAPGLGFLGLPVGGFLWVPISRRVSGLFVSSKKPWDLK
jgi:hypothetical protein